MFCSTIIATIGRPTLSRAASSVLGQKLTAADFEIIIVNDSGEPLPKEDWHLDEKVRIVDTHQRERSVARNTGAAIAKGQYLHFLDDDDWMLPNAFADFWQLSHLAPHAAWLFGGCRLVDRQEKFLIDLHSITEANGFIQVMAGEWIPLLSSLISHKAFLAVGGFHPDIVSGEDVDLSRRIALRGDFEKMRSVVACAAIDTGNSSSSRKYAKNNCRMGREEILQTPGAFKRMRDSAKTSYWDGRIARIYLTSAVWNIQRGRLLTAASRLFCGAIYSAAKSTHLLSTDFWQAILYPYKSESFAAGRSSAKLQDGA